MEKDKETVRLTHNLRVLMALKGFNPRSLSLTAGLNATAVRDILEGRARSPRYNTIQALANALQVTPAQLMASTAPDAPDEDEQDLRQDDLNLLTEIIARLQETTEDRKHPLAPRDFAAMAMTIYRQVQTQTPGLDLASHIDQLVNYETLRRRLS